MKQNTVQLVLQDIIVVKLILIVLAVLMEDTLQPRVALRVHPVGQELLVLVVLQVVLHAIQEAISLAQAVALVFLVLKDLFVQIQE